MGICSSCLGRRTSDAEHSDTSHLLADPYQPHYGTAAAPGPHSAGPQPDPEEIRRQRDALERICAQTSDKLIHVSQTTHLDSRSKMAAEYSRLFNERFPPLHAAAGGSRPASADASADEDESAWLGQVIGESSEAEGSWGRVEPVDAGLTVNFGEPLGAADKRVGR